MFENIIALIVGLPALAALLEVVGYWNPKLDLEPIPEGFGKDKGPLLKAFEEGLGDLPTLGTSTARYAGLYTPEEDELLFGEAQAQPTLGTSTARFAGLYTLEEDELLFGAAYSTGAHSVLVFVSQLTQAELAWYEEAQEWVAPLTDSDLERGWALVWPRWVNQPQPKALALDEAYIF